MTDNTLKKEISIIDLVGSPLFINTDKANMILFDILKSNKKEIVLDFKGVDVVIFSVLRILVKGFSGNDIDYTFINQGRNSERIDIIIKEFISELKR